MADFPTTIAPSSVDLSALQPTGKAESVNGKTQAVSSGVHKWKLKFTYDLLTFQERNELVAFISSQQGRAYNFTLNVPTYTFNPSVSVGTVTVAETASAGTSTVKISGLISGDSFNYLNMISFVGRTKIYSVTEFGAEVSGNQTLTVHPPLAHGLTVGDVITCKNAKFTVALDSDSIMANTQQMTSSLSFSMTEEL